MINKKKLIDLDKTLKRLEKESWWLDSVKSCIRMFLAKEKLVDAEEVVRCKECAVPHNQWTGCPKLNGLVPPQYFYCAFGERGTDNG